ncbi:MAG: hypothetical protein WA830_20200 [Candidatus Sulfotelmatobacter sp.]
MREVSELREKNHQLEAEMAKVAAREPSDERTGVFTSGIVSTGQGWKIALYFTGRQHAGENLADVLQQRAQRGQRSGQSRSPTSSSDIDDALGPELEVQRWAERQSVLRGLDPLL